jgi:hypothetical protein
MLLSAALATPFVGALAIIVTTAVLFGRKYGDARESLLAKTKTDELNDLRLAIRDEHTIPKLQDLWEFLNNTNEEMKKIDLELDVESLKFDVQRRDKFNRLTNDIFHAFKIEAGVKQCWDELLIHYASLGRVLYVLGATAALGGYSIVILSLTPVLDSAVTEVIVAAALVILVCLLLGVQSFSLLKRIGRSLKLYQDAVSKYLADVPRVM